ncbi:sugar transferase [Anaerosinus massiliensis]|uniref:sugar transferase n=1 Tax=Massilibacillus massiliensis TaxID=1806837 RepID=UPI000AA8890A|nr:sugar transferase [Massilibacillus massiliensis]
MQRKFPTLRKLVLLCGDIGIVILSTYLAVSFIFYYRPPQMDMEIYHTMLPVSIITIGILLNVHGLFSLSKKRYSEILLGVGISVLNLLIIMMAFSFFVREFAYSRSVLGIAAILQFIFLALWKYAFWRMERMLIAPRKALIIGAEEECNRIFIRLKHQSQLRYEICYVCTDSSSEEWKSVISNIDMVIICSDLNLKSKAEIMHACQMLNKQVLLVPDVYELFCSGLELDKIDDIPVFRPKYLNPSLEQRSLKRIVDVLISGVALIITAPIMVMTAIAIKLESAGPAFYSQVRTGRYEKNFKIYKFRSMRQDAETKSGPVMAAENDPRITKLGNFLRATRLDELPQLINVLLGDMSIVGPRPERPFFVDQFKKKIPEYVYRHNVKPGITGMAQVYGKYNTTAYDKLIYDLMYIQKCNVFTDLVVMIQTVKVLLTKSSTEGVGINKSKMNLKQYEVNETKDSSNMYRVM